MDARTPWYRGMEAVREKCPYCDEELRRWALDRHVVLCLENPDVAESVRDILLDLSFMGIVPPRKLYEEEVAWQENVPSGRLLVSRLGSWDEVARWADLLTIDEGKAVARNRALQFIVELGEQLHQGRVGPTSDEYDLFRETWMPAGSGLRREFGGWHAVLELLGLPLGRRKYYRRQDAEREAAGLSRRLSRPERRRVLLRRLEDKLATQEDKGIPSLPPQVVRFYDYNVRRWVVRESYPLR